MTQSSRRKARRVRAARRQQAQDRIARRRAEIEAGVRTGPKVATRKDREALSTHGGDKQRRKHLDKKVARVLAERERRNAALLEQLREVTTAAPVELVRLDFLGSAVPYEGDGTVRDRAGRDLLWTFRFRYDRAFLEVGVPDPECDDLVGECVLAASRDDVTGEPYAGYLDDEAAVGLLGELFTELAPPQSGARFGERLQNTVALATGIGGNASAPTLIRTLAT